MEASWEQCPFCTADRVETDESGNREAIVVAKKVAPVRVLVGWIVVRSGEQAGEDFRLLSGKNVVGKGPTAAIVIRDPYLSETHASIDYRADKGYTVRDLESKHGTFVNGESVTAGRALHDGDLLQMGRTEMRFRSYED
jgi:hypothetical protein